MKVDKTARLYIHSNTLSCEYCGNESCEFIYTKHVPSSIRHPWQNTQETPEQKRGHLVPRLGREAAIKNAAPMVTWTFGATCSAPNVVIHICTLANNQFIEISFTPLVHISPVLDTATATHKSVTENRVGSI